MKNGRHNFPELILKLFYLTNNPKAKDIKFTTEIHVRSLNQQMFGILYFHFWHFVQWKFTEKLASLLA